MSERLVCSKCGKTKREEEFFKIKGGERCDMCKPCLTMHVENTKPDTFMWILEKFNVPYIERTWISMSNKIRLKDPARFGPMSVIGQYLRAMNMTQYREYTYADSDRLNFEHEKELAEAEARRLAEGKDDAWELELKQKYEAGLITKAQYETLSIETEPPKDGNETFVQINEFDEEKIRKELTEEDYQYLSLKWGTFYKPSEWIKMEDLYCRYVSEYELNVDREETLKKICKTSLKMDIALDMGDTSAYKSLSGVFDQLRKSGKFTEVQNKEEQTKFLDTIGELVALVEKEGGAIPAQESAEDFPKDKVDLTLRDMKSYVYNLVKNEMGLGDLIETYVEKLEKQLEENAKRKSLEAGLVINEEEEHEGDLTDKEAFEYQSYIENEIEKDANLLLEMTDGDSNGVK